MKEKIITKEEVGIMNWFFEYDHMLVISTIMKWYAPFFSVAAMIVAIAMGVRKKEEGGIGSVVALFAALFFSIISILIVVCLCLGTFNLETVDYYSDNGTYFGQVKGNEAHGKGRYFDENGNLIYCGEFKNNKYDGEGKYYTVGSQGGKQVSILYYEGEFQEGKLQGSGKRYYVSGDEQGELQYEGEFYDSKLNGKGTLYYREKGKIYQGGFAQSYLYGYGKLTYLNDEGNEEILLGTFAWDMLNGYGEWYRNGRLKYEGGFSNGQYSGNGSLYYDNGNLMYEGEFLEGEFEGEGILYSEENPGERAQEGTWKDGTFVQ